MRTKLRKIEIDDQGDAGVDFSWHFEGDTTGGCSTSSFIPGSPTRVLLESLEATICILNDLPRIDAVNAKDKNE